MRRCHLVALAAIHLLFYVIYFTPRLREDAPYYYEPLRSAFFDGDLCFYNERPFTRPVLSGARRQFVAGPNERQRPIVGGPNNSFDIGTTVLEVPFFLAGHGAARVANLLGRPVALHGYSAPYVLAMSLGALTVGFGAVLLLYRACLDVAAPADAFAATVFASFGTFLPAYLYEDTLLSHLPSFAAATLLVALLAAARRQPRAATLLSAGAAFAWLVMARRQNLLFGVLFLIVPIDAWREGVVRSRLPRAVALCLAGFFVFLMPELCIWKVEYGSFLANPGMVPLRRAPVLVKVLLSDHGGLFSHSPILIAAVAGLFFLVRRQGIWGGLLVVSVLLQIAINALRVEWWSGIGFGNRRSDSSLPILALGLAALLQALRQGGRILARRLLFAILLVLFLWNMAFLPQFYAGDRVSEQGSYYGKFAATRRPAAARVRWPFPAISDLPSLVAEDVRIAAARSLTLSGARHAPAALALTALVALLLSLAPTLRIGWGRLALPATVAALIYALVLSASILRLLASERRVLALYYDLPEGLQTLVLGRHSPFVGGITPIDLVPGSTSRWDVLVPFTASAVELVTAPTARARACITLDFEEELQVEASGGEPVTFPNAGHRQTIALASARAPVSVSIRSCGSAPLAIYGLGLSEAAAHER